jgi:hypothetical protein
VRSAKYGMQVPNMSYKNLLDESTTAEEPRGEGFVWRTKAPGTKEYHCQGQGKGQGMGALQKARNRPRNGSTTKTKK